MPDARHANLLEPEALVELFRVLDTKLQDRDPYLQDDNPELAAFPYVNGGLFSDENIEIPPFTDEIRNLLLNKATVADQGIYFVQRFIFDASEAIDLDLQRF